MPSPFPGMNPYLEREGIWQDFHTRYVAALSDALTEQVLPDYIVSLEEHLYIHEPPEPEGYRIGRSDLAVKPGEPRWRASHETATAVMDAPAYSVEPVNVTETVAEPYLEIRSRDDEEIVTVLELLSPSNKRSGPDRDVFVAKRRKYFHSYVNYVELDLLRGFEQMPLEETPVCDYRITVKRTTAWPRVGLWPLRLRDPLPEIPIPLKPHDRDAKLNLGEVLNQVYDRAGYRFRIYAAPPRPPLLPDEASWANALIAEHLASEMPRRRNE